METPNWDDLITLGDWAATLEELLGEAEQAIDSSSAKRQEITGLLEEYVDKSPFSAAPLDQIATNAIIALALDDIEAALEAIHKANTDLKKQIDLINGVSKQAHADGKKLGMEHANKLLADAKPALKALRKANNELGKPDAKTTKKIDEVIKVIEGLTG